MKYKLYILLSFSLMAFLMACEEDVTLDLPQGEERFVVEGYIEQGMPPVVMITKTLPYFSANGIDILNGIFVAGADVRIFDGTDTFDLLEINLSSLPDSIAKILIEMFQLSGDNLSELNIVFYTSIQLFGQVGKTYTLLVDKDDHKLKAVTTIPAPVTLDSAWIEPHPSPKVDSFYLVKFAFNDPPDQNNYYRLFNSRNNGPFYPNGFFSVADDQLVNGDRVEINLINGEPLSPESDPRSFGFYKIGDTVNIKLCSVDEAHHDFWNTFESARFSGGPFANPVYILSNVEGGLGVWGGYGASFYQIIIKP